MDLKDTENLMQSADYKERFRAEYWQTAIRYRKLCDMLENWDAGLLNFTPTCPRSIYDVQKNYMSGYLAILEARAVMENIIL